MSSAIGPVRSLCRRPFEGLEILWDGSVHCCVPGWLPVCVGNVPESTIEEIWNSANIQAIRKTVSDGSYASCSGQDCPHLSEWRANGRVGKNSPLILIEDVSSLVAKNDLSQDALRYSTGWHAPWPVELSLSYDYTCALDCGMCRSGIRRVQSGSADDVRFSRITDNVLRVVPHISRLKVGLSGEPFDSRHYMRVLSSLNSDQHRDLSVHLTTNGIGLTSQALKSFEQRGVFFESVEVSIDASTAETYEWLRRRGRFSVLLENLSAIGEFRRYRRISRLTLSFVVQAGNFREMSAFVNLGRQVGADRVVFRRIDDWKVMSAERFHKIAIHRPQHPEHEEFKKVLQDPMLRSSDIELSGLDAFNLVESGA